MIVDLLNAITIKFILSIEDVRTHLSKLEVFSYKTNAIVCLQTPIKRYFLPDRARYLESY